MRWQIYVLILILGIFSCSTNDENNKNRYEFIKEYSTTVTVGGVVGTIERTFEIGESYEGTDQGNNIIKIRIAEHSELNDDCPNSWCYQELLDVPHEFLKVVE